MWEKQSVMPTRPEEGVRQCRVLQDRRRLRGRTAPQGPPRTFDGQPGGTVVRLGASPATAVAEAAA